MGPINEMRKKFVDNKFVKTCDEFVLVGCASFANNLVISNHMYCLLNYYTIEPLAK